MCNSCCRTLIPVEKIENDCYDWYARHAKKICAVATNSYDLVFIGDSITHFMNDEDHNNGGDIWEKRISSRFKAINLGFGFDRTQNVLWRLEHGELANQKPKLIVLNIGTNQFSITQNYSGDSSEDAAKGVIAVIKKLKLMCPNTHLLVMAVLPRKQKNDPIRSKISGLNKIIETYVQEDKDIDFIDCTFSFVNQDGTLKEELFSDKCCHPNFAGYTCFLDALEDKFKQYLF